MKGRVKVHLVPLGDKIKYRIAGRIACSRCGELCNSRTYTRGDTVWLNVFGSSRAIARFLKRNKQVARVIRLDDLMYDSCDRVI